MGEKDAGGRRAGVGGYDDSLAPAEGPATPALRHNLFRGVCLFSLTVMCFDVDVFEVY
jgi:hypothetical protein